jgi:hypothetical protein
MSEGRREIIIPKNQSSFLTLRLAKPRFPPLQLAEKDKEAQISAKFVGALGRKRSMGTSQVADRIQGCRRGKLSD